MNIFITNLQRSISIPISKIEFAAKNAHRKLKLTHPELSIVFVGAKRMRLLNKKYLGHDYVTDVITFDHGEIIVCPQVASRNALKFKNTVDKELILYVIHGILHLAGYDDNSSDDIVQMRKKEIELT